VIAIAYSWPDVLVFATAALLTLSGAVGVVRAKNPVHSALCLIVTLFGVAVAFLAQSADFLAAVQIIVYAGAIVVLFLFVIMFLGIDRQSSDVEPLVGQRALAATGSLITVAGIVALMWRSGWVTGVKSVSTNGVALAGPDNNVRQLGTSVFTTYLFAFEITAALLLIGVIGAVILARKTEEETQ
jgi:NADH-quinone oxidoreductase subunit J